jgi:enoyl-CoA hydratase
MSYQTLLYAVENRVAVVTVNRPDKLNALNGQAKTELRELFAALRLDSAVDVVIVTGAGEKSFVAGTDIGELTGLNLDSGREFAQRGQEVFDLIENLGKPVIAAVNGYALGGGCELALACHIRLASETARFGQPEVNLGIMPGYGGTQRLARVIGKGRAMEMILTGVPIDAHEAHRIGLVNKVYPQADLMPKARVMAALIGTMGQRAIHFALEAVNAAGDTALNVGLGLEATLFGECCDTEDFKEGTRAFLEKRKPAFKNR